MGEVESMHGRSSFRILGPISGRSNSHRSPPSVFWSGGPLPASAFRPEFRSTTRSKLLFWQRQAETRISPLRVVLPVTGEGQVEQCRLLSRRGGDLLDARAGGWRDASGFDASMSTVDRPSSVV